MLFSIRLEPGGTAEGTPTLRSEIRVTLRYSAWKVRGTLSLFGFVTSRMWLYTATEETLSPFRWRRSTPPVSAPYTPSLFPLEKCKNVRLIHLVDYGRVEGTSPYAGQGFNPHIWSMVLNADTNTSTPPMDRPAMYLSLNWINALSMQIHLKLPLCPCYLADSYTQGLLIYYKPRPRNYRVLHRALYNPRPQAEGCMRGVKPDNFEAEACNIFKFFRLLSPVIEALSTSFFRRRKSCGE